MRFDRALRSDIEARLGAFPRRAATSDQGSLSSAAVALCLMPDDTGDACFVLTQRPLHIKRHAGQFALPGGRVDPGETPTQAALRELQEEVGLSAAPSSVLGLLDDYETRSGFCITPVVVWMDQPEQVLTPNPEEVARTFLVRLSELLTEDVVHIQQLEENTPPVLSLALVNNRVFAPTAAMLFQLREVALLGRATRVDAYGQPRFAWQ